MKHFGKLIITLTLILSLTTCNKDKNQPLGYRMIHSNSILYGSTDHHSEGSISYSDNHITNSIVEVLANSTFENKFKNTYEYFGDSVINRSYISENDKLNLNRKIVYHTNNSLIAMINSYRYPDSITLTSKSLLKYENNNLIEFNTYSPVGIIESFSTYQYDGENLTLASYSFRMFEDEDPKEYVRREFTYVENKLHEELIYKDFNGYPIQLAYKKMYNYENGLLAKVDNFEFEDGTFTLYKEEAYSYDEAGNIISIISKDPSGSVVSEGYMTYELGTYKYQLIYKVVSGVVSKYPLN